MAIICNYKLALKESSVSALLDQAINKEIRKYKFNSGSSNMGQDSAAKSPWTGCSQFLPTTQKIIQFSDGKAPKSGDRIVSQCS